MVNTRILVSEKRNVPGEVLGRKTANRGKAPNLKEMSLLRPVSFLAMAYSSASGCELDITTFQYLGIPHRVFAEVARCKSKKKMKRN